jgi:Tfp pilus tip-associated adhesin PilY1/regulation of enolase protein 1 (concanavalin A-like superfamily)
MKNKYRYRIICFITALFAFLPLHSNAQVMSDYTAYPPFISSGAAPNILLLLDVSGSMQFPAYYDCSTSFSGYSAKRAVCGSSDSIQSPNRAYDPNYDYYGLFKNDKYYEYSSNQFIEKATCSFSSSDSGYRIGDNSQCISGNLLNWATMTRIDLLRKALIGGKSVSQQTNAHTLRGEGGWWTYSDHTLGCTFTIDGGSYPQLDHSVSISDYASAGYLYVTSSGSQIIGTIDSFRFVYQSVTGDFDAKLLIKNPPDETGQTYAKAGLMVRTSTAADSQHVKAMATYGAGLQFSYRDTDGADSIINGYVSVTYPYWVRIKRVGNVFTYYYSSDGSSWTMHSMATVAMPAATPVLIGMASASYSATALGTAEYDRFICDTCTVTDDDFDAGSLGASWTALDINTSVAGSDSLSPVTCMVGTLASADIKVDVPENERRGVIQNISDKDYDGTYDANAPRFGLMVYASDNRYGCIRTGIEGANMSNLINALQAEPPYYGTPTGEAFNEAWDYFIQTDDHNGCNNNAYIGGIGSAKDPWCDSGEPQACRKSYVLHISDGEWSGSVDPVVPARNTHINDIRTDAGMDGTQILTWYNVYIFGDTQIGINAMQQASLYGAFDDYDTDSWPYDRAGYPADSRNATLPSAPCDPSALPMDAACKEWDEDQDGLPDTYYEASDGNKLESQLIQAITDILKRSSSGTAVSVLATTGEGEGAIYQAFFFPEKLENIEARHWLGYLHSIFVDKYGNLREDTNGNDTLDMGTDLILEMTYDQALGTQVNKYLDADSDGQKDSSSPTATTPLENINPIWKGGEILWQTSPASRTIFTSIDGHNEVGFTTANLASIEPYLRGADSTEATNIINWVRGDDLSGITDTGHPDGYRKRSITISGITNVWKLGDIIYSTPTTVGPPMENYDLLYGDGTYTDFRYGYLNRRRVVYLGANDGMLHAFNAGCYSESDHKFYPDVSVSGSCTSGSHILGGELWAFIPRALLPHLKWSTDPDYTHVYYVDSKPKVSDVRMFNADTTHINGWGTILIGSLRYGGKDISWTSGGTNYSTSPEYFALDITDPLNPHLLWTFSDPDLGFSMSYPAIAHIKTGSTHRWYAIFGSGATNYDSGSNLTAFQDGYVYVLDIGSGDAAGKISTWTENTNFWKIATGNATAFLSDAISVDANIDNKADVMYIGENYKQGGTWNALMHRITTNYGVQTDPSQWVLSTLADVNSIAGNNDDSKRITAAPAIAIDNRWNFWVYFGTGQFYGLADKNQTETGAFYGIKDGCYDGSCTTSYSSLLDVSGAAVGADLSVSGVSGTCGGSGVSSWSSLLSASYACDGWSIYFKNLAETTDFTGTTLSHNGERSVSKPLVLGGLVMYSTYIPGVNICSYEGESNIYSVYYKTGTGYKKYIFKEQKDSGTTTQDIARVKKLGAGMPSSISAQVTKSGTAKGFSQNQFGAILGVEAETPISQKSGIVGWRSEEID